MLKVIRFSFLLLLVSLPFFPLAADPEIESSTELALQVSSRPEAKLILTQSFTLPLLRGASPLTEGNNLKTVFSAEVTPISVNGAAGLTWTPIAFLQINAGGRLGSGWNMSLGNGIGINAPLDKNAPLPRKAEIRGSPFEGLYWGFHGGAALQFDLAALFPGDWHHLVIRTAHEGRYRAYTGASSDEAWIFEADMGENLNGFTYYGNLLLGYLMPASPLLNMTGFLAEVERSFYHISGGDSWGEDLPRWYIGALFNIGLSERLSLSLIVQTRTLRNYNSTDLENRDHLYYRDLTLEKSDPYRLVFYRVAAILTAKLR